VTTAWRSIASEKIRQASDAPQASAKMSGMASLKRINRAAHLGGGGKALWRKQ